MESIGDKLTTTREGKGYTVEQIARDTNIAKRYLEALEQENFEIFPGEPYLLGFLRNYAEYLGLNPEELVALYKNLQIQEQPVPIDELLEKRNPRAILVIAALVVVIGGVVASGIIFIPRLFDNRGSATPASRSEETAQTAIPVATERPAASGNTYRLTDEILEQRFAVGDVISIPVRDVDFDIALMELDNGLTISVPGGTALLNLGEERTVDLDGDANMDIKIFVRDIDKNDTMPGVVLRFDRFIKATVAPEPSEPETEAASEPEVVESEPVAVETLPTLGSTDIGSRQQKPIDILTSDTAEPFTMNVVFRGYCLFRYIVDGSVREERYFHKGETTRIDANREIRLWLSNAGSFTAKIGGYDVDVGRPGEITAKLIAWTQDEDDGNYTLRVMPVY